MCVPVSHSRSSRRRHGYVAEACWQWQGMNCAHPPGLPGAAPDKDMAQGEGVGAWHARDPACHWPASLPGNAAALATARRRPGYSAPNGIFSRLGVVGCGRRLDVVHRRETGGGGGACALRRVSGRGSPRSHQEAAALLFFPDDGGRHKFPGPVAQKAHQSPCLGVDVEHRY